MKQFPVRRRNDLPGINQTMFKMKSYSTTNVLGTSSSGDKEELAVKQEFLVSHQPLINHQAS